MARVRSHPRFQIFDDPIPLAEFAQQFTCGGERIEWRVSIRSGNRNEAVTYWEVSRGCGNAVDPDPNRCSPDAMVRLSLLFASFRLADTKIPEFGGAATFVTRYSTYFGPFYLFVTTSFRPSRPLLRDWVKTTLGVPCNDRGYLEFHTLTWRPRDELLFPWSNHTRSSCILRHP